jgi:hypothetical protein
LAEDLSDIAGKIFKLIHPLKSDERKRVINAALMLAGETAVDQTQSKDGTETDMASSTKGGGAGLPARARSWMTQHNISKAQLDRIFHIDGDKVDLITKIPGNTTSKKARNTYVLTGLSRLIATGKPDFSDELARANCETASCFDFGNHAKTVSAPGSGFTGSKAAGWTITTPSLEKAAELVKEMAKI